jgi:SAM-dependent methyltransferase
VTVPSAAHALRRIGSVYDYPLYYDILYGWDRDAEAVFYDSFFCADGAPRRGRLLEVACGTGQIALRLAARGWRLTGLDRRPAMLAFMQERARARGLTIEACCDDMTDFRLAELQDGAFCPMGSFHLLPDDASAIAHLRCVASVLAAHGAYVLDLAISPAGHSLNDDIEPWSVKRDGLTVSAGSGGITVANCAGGNELSLDWGGALRSYTIASLERVLEQAAAFAVEALHPVYATTEDGVSVFHLAHWTADLQEGRAMVVLRCQ